MACSTTALTGAAGNIVVDGTRMKRVTSWRVNPTVGESAWGDSDGGGWTQRRPGRKDNTFTTEGKYDTDRRLEAVANPGDIATLTLWLTATLYWYVACALCQSFDYLVNVDTQEVVGWTMTWAPDGTVYYPGETNIPAATLPAS